jgi:hypothetical protein
LPLPRGAFGKEVSLTMFYEKRSGTPGPLLDRRGGIAQR